MADAFGNVIDQVKYSDKAPWSETADGAGYYLELVDVNSDNAIASNWKASSSDLLNTNSFDNRGVHITVFLNPAEDNLSIKSKQSIQSMAIFNTLIQQIKTYQIYLKSGKLILEN